MKNTLGETRRLAGLRRFEQLLRKPEDSLTYLAAVWLQLHLPLVLMSLWPERAQVEETSQLGAVHIRPSVTHIILDGVPITF